MVFFQKHPWTRPMMTLLGAQGIVVGPSCSQSSRVAVRFTTETTESCEEVVSWKTPIFRRSAIRKSKDLELHVGVSLNGDTPKTPQNDHLIVGKPMVVGCHHFRKPPMFSKFLPKKPWNFNMELPEMEVWKVISLFNGCGSWVPAVNFQGWKNYLFGLGGIKLDANLW